MSKKILCFILLFTTAYLFPVETVVFKDAESINFLEKADENGYFFKAILGVDVDETGFYFLDAALGTVFRVDKKSGKLINTISSKGQGPSELHDPSAIRVRNKLVFVSDIGFKGIKVFEPGGKLIKEFKTSHTPFRLDVNNQNEIFVKGRDTDANPGIFVYNMKGVKLRDFIIFPPKENDRKDFMLNERFSFKLDNYENIVVSFRLKKIIRKYDKKGKLLWERELKNQVIDSFDTRAKFQFKNTGAVRFSESVFGMDIDENDNIIIGHRGGGVVYNRDGDIIKLIQFQPDGQLSEFRVYDDSLLHIIRLGRRIQIFKFTI